ncbi:MAG: hypothetical protein JKX92_06020 [Porticoccaceae bacterium]|nr:hypothetical protein [Porticoccaceae bacterium]
MAIWWASSATGANSNDGTSYTTPKKYLWVNDGTSGLFYGAIKPLAGDTVYVLDGHIEDPGASLVMAGGAATGDELIRVINVASFNGGSPDTLGVARGCLVGAPDNGYIAGRDISLRGGLDIYGFTFTAGDEIFGNNGTGVLKLKGCRLKQNRLGATRKLALSDTSLGLFTCYFEDVWYSLASTNHSYGVICAGVKLVQTGGKFESPVAYGFSGFQDGAQIHISEFDWGNVTTLTSSTANGDGAVLDVDIRSSYLPATFSIQSGTSSPGQVVKITNCKNAAGSNSEYLMQYSGLVSSETTIVRTGGAEIDGVGYSYEMTPNTKVSGGNPLKCLTISGHADFSTSKNIDIYIANNVRDLNDTEMYFTLSYPTYNQGGNTLANSQGATALLNPTTIPDDTTSIWGGSQAYMQKMSVTAGGATEGREGPYQIDIFLAVDVDVFADPKPVIT